MDQPWHDEVKYKPTMPSNFGVAGLFEISNPTERVSNLVFSNFHIDQVGENEDFTFGWMA